MKFDDETLGKVNHLYNGLQDMLQDGYRKSMVPLTKQNYIDYFTKIHPHALAIDCYFSYLYMKDINSEIETRYQRCYAYPEAMYKVAGTGKHADFSEYDNIVIVPKVENKTPKIYVKTMYNWNSGIQLFVDSESVGYYKQNTYDELKEYYGKN